MSPRSHSRSITPRRSYSRSPYRSKGRRQHKYSSRSCSNSQPPSPPPLGTKRNRSRYSSRSISRSISPVYKKRYSSRKHYSRSRSKTKSRSTSPSSTSYDKNIRNTRDNPKPSRCIGVFGLSVYTTQQKIREIFSKYGDIERIQVITDAQTRRSRGFCFIYYENLSDARTACDNCCGMEIDGRRIRVAYSVTQRPHTPTPGVYMGESVTNVRKRFREQKLKQRHHSPVTYRSHRSSRHRYERSRSRSYTPRRRY